MGFSITLFFWKYARVSHLFIDFVFLFLLMCFYFCLCWVHAD